MTAAADGPMNGRRAEAAANDGRILEAARSVFLADPAAPIAAVAQRAGVGIGAVYRRYASKEDLLRKLCGDGLQRFIDELQLALADEREPWIAFADFMRRAVDADTSSLTNALAGTFTPTPQLWQDGARANELLTALVARTRDAGALRAGVEVHDLSLIFELLAGVRTGDPQRNAQLRQRYLDLLLDALQRSDAQPLPGAAPTWEEINQRWAGS